MPIALTIAGSDSGGGAGIQADLKTFQELDVFGTSVITALTAQNTLGVHGIVDISPSFVELQLEAVLHDFSLGAIKTGMLFSAEIIESVAKTLSGYSIPLVLDPVMIAKGGESLLQEEAIEALYQYLLPKCTVCTPNIPEANILSGLTITSQEDVRTAAMRILEHGAQCVVMKGGHMEQGEVSRDTVFFANGDSFTMQTPRIDTKHTHGTGCTFSAAITALLSRGLPVAEAIIEAKRFVQMAIQYSLQIGHGYGPTNHFAYRHYEKQCEVLVHETIT